MVLAKRRKGFELAEKRADSFYQKFLEILLEDKEKAQKYFSEKIGKLNRRNTKSFYYYMTWNFYSAVTRLFDKSSIETPADVVKTLIDLKEALESLEKFE